jgi:hypothetical protein
LILLGNNVWLRKPEEVTSMSSLRIALNKRKKIALVPDFEECKEREKT